LAACYAAQNCIYCFENWPMFGLVEDAKGEEVATRRIAEGLTSYAAASGLIS
jgi:hypothetical protein